jgi:phosphoglycerate dehydrogenase-like enzyme
MVRPKVVVSSGKELFESFFSAVGQRRLTSLCHWERNNARNLTPSLRRQLGKTGGLITTWDSPRFDAEILQIAPNLQIISHCGGEVKSRFARSLFEKLTITTAAEPMAFATAELGAALLLYCARNIDFYRAELRKPSNRIYVDVHARGSAESLVGRQVAMIGFGRIGRALVDLLRGFNLRWLVYDPYADSSLSNRYPVCFTNLRTVLKDASLLVLTAALTDDTRGILDAENLARLPDSATIINIARGGLIHLDALTREVKRKRLRCALDVTDPKEPLPIDHPLRDMPGAIVTPHVGGGHRRVRQEMAGVVMDDLERFFQGKPVTNRVTSSMLERMT